MKPLDMSKFTKHVTKAIPNISVGFKDPDVWISTGNYTLNYLISGRFDRGVPLSRVTMLAGESGSGKSFLASGNLIANAQKQGVFCVLIDTENALDDAWLSALGVDTSAEKLLKVNLAMIDDVAKFINEYMKFYKEQYENVPPADRQRLLIVIDSLGMLLTPTDVNQFEEGNMKGDMGRKAKALTALVRNLVNLLGSWDVGLVCTNHTYSSQDMFNPDDVVSGGQGFVYASSIVLAMRKLKLKEDDEGNKVSEVRGIRAQCKIMKTRYSKPFEAVEVKIPYETGMDPFSGLVDLFETKGMLQKSGNQLEYIDLAGNSHKEFRKEWIRNHDLKKLLMGEFYEWSDRKFKSEVHTFTDADVPIPEPEVDESELPDDAGQDQLVEQAIRRRGRPRNA
jgi:RecA/RadA recombinase